MEEVDQHTILGSKERRGELESDSERGGEEGKDRRRRRKKEAQAADV